MRPAGPGRSANCRPVDVFAPPPLPIQVINITSSHIVSITRVTRELQDVTVSARSASQYLNTPIYPHTTVLLKSERHIAHLCTLRDINYMYVCT